MNADQLTLLAVVPLLAAALLFALIRLVKGPSLPDRVVALELISIVSIGVIVVAAVVTGQSIYLDAAVILALVSFLATIAFAYYFEKKGFD